MMQFDFFFNSALRTAMEDAAWEDGTINFNVIEAMHDIGINHFKKSNCATSITGDYDLNLDALQELIADVWCGGMDVINY